MVVLSKNNGKIKETEFDALTDKLRRLRTRKRILMLLKTTGEAVGLAAVPILVVLALAKLMPIPALATTIAYSLAAVVAIVWIILRGILPRITIVHCSHDADVAHDLKDRLTSALYLRHLAGEDPYIDTLVKDAMEKSEKVEPKSVYPWKYPKSWRLSGATTLCTLLILFVPYLGWLESDKGREEREQLAEAGKRLIKLSKEIEKKNTSLEIKENKELVEKFSKLGEKMELGKLEKGKALEEMNKLMSELDKAKNQSKDTAQEKFMSDLSKKLMQDEKSRKMGEEMKDGKMKDLMDELNRLKERLENDQLSASELEALENLSQALKETMETNPEFADKLDKAAIEKALKSLQENLAKEKERQKQIKSMLDELKEATDRFNEGLKDSGLKKETQPVEESLKKLTEDFEKNGTCSKESISELRKSLEQANKQMQASNASDLEKRVAQDRADEIKKLLDKMEQKCSESKG